MILEPTGARYVSHVGQIHGMEDVASILVQTLDYFHTHLQGALS